MGGMFPPFLFTACSANCTSFSNPARRRMPPVRARDTSGQKATRRANAKTSHPKYTKSKGPKSKATHRQTKTKTKTKPVLQPPSSSGDEYSSGDESNDTEYENPIRKRRWRPGTVQKRRSKQQQQSVESNIPQAPYNRLIARKMRSPVRFASGVREVLKAASEAWLIALISDAVVAKSNRNRLTLKPQDIKSAAIIRRDQIDEADGI